MQNAYPDQLLTQIANQLKNQNAMLGVVESCTGGMIAEYFTRQAGSSSYFSGALVTYATEQKINLLGIDQDFIQSHGVVSQAVAAEMAKKGAQVLGVNYCISTTGFAGPSIDSSSKYPVGTVFLGFFDNIKKQGEAFEIQILGDRQCVRHDATIAILKYLYTNIS